MKSFLWLFLAWLPFLSNIAVADIVIDIEEVSVVSSSLPANVSVGVFAAPGTSVNINSFNFLFDIHQGATGVGVAFPPDISFVGIANPLSGMTVTAPGSGLADVAIAGFGTSAAVALPGQVKLFDLVLNVQATATAGEVFDVDFFFSPPFPQVADNIGATTFAAGTDFTGSITVAAVPEPSAFAFLGLVSSVCLGAVTWRRYAK